MTQVWIVGVLVFLATVYSIWYVLPEVARKRLGKLHRLLGSAPSCTSCSDCGKCATRTVTKLSARTDGLVITIHRKE